MNALAPKLLAHAPETVKRQALALLFRSTAAAFRCDMPRLSGLSREQCLLEYAQSTAGWAEEALRDSADPAELRERLYGNAHHLGCRVGRLLGVRSVEEVMIVGRFLYGILEIDFEGNGSGDIAISSCYFSGFYSPQLCRVMSAMDRGLLAGLAAGGDLVFSQRITEGEACCRAQFTWSK